MIRTITIRASDIPNWIDGSCDVTKEGDILFPKETWYCLGKSNGLVVYLIGGLSAMNSLRDAKQAYHA